ncbi:MAG: 16S rRNA methyltransferase [Desulfurococcaceae archaeon]|jgi:rRNA small subunit pseudouridine methyltransferase Nep1|nr:16S rRNA methyltransferase [Desulfurococcaceae archaeon]MCC6054078.1 16S rRNA methyltransferase [Thermosphaera sp.]
MESRFKLLLLEASLETVPVAIAHHPSVVKTAARRGKKPLEILLDKSLHYHAMKKLPNAEKRGRPDIVHIALLEALESPLNKKGELLVCMYTIEKHAVYIDPSTRIPRSYNRFVGLMEQLFKEGRIPPGSDKPLIYLKTIKLGELIKEIGARGLILLSEKCDYKPVSFIAEKAIREELAVGVGAFPHGDFDEETTRYADYCYSIYPEPLATHIVVSRVLVAAEKLLGVFEL